MIKSMFVKAKVDIYGHIEDKDHFIDVKYENDDATAREIKSYIITAIAESHGIKESGVLGIHSITIL